MSKVKVSAVKYTNSIPFIYGLQNSPHREEMDLSLDTPAECYNKLVSGAADIGLVPVILKNSMPGLKRITDFCIGTRGNVHSVILVSPSPLSAIRTIYLDYQSRTSVMLTKLLCRDYWKINPEFLDARPGYEDEKLGPNEAKLVIGDRSFNFHRDNNLCITDLAGEWKKCTGRPFVFAFWASSHELSPEFEQLFSDALRFGIEHKDQLVKEMEHMDRFRAVNLHKYLSENIIHEIDPSMLEGMNLFLNLIRDFH